MRTTAPTLYPYQSRDAVRLARALARARSVLYVLPTGGGKTVVAVAVMRAEVEDNGRVLFIAHRRELVDQAFDQLVASGLPESEIGVIMGADARRRPEARVQIASIDTLRQRSELPDAGLVVVDEAHRAPAKTYQVILAAYPEARVLGLTATPLRLDGRGLRDTFDELVVGPSVVELVEAGRLSKPRVFGPPDELLPDLRGVRTTGGDFNLRDLAEATNRRVLVGSITEHWLKHAGSRPTVAYAVDIAGAKMIRDAFLAVGVTAEHVDGETPAAEREAILARLRAGQTKVVTNCAVLTEGWDFPDLGCVILARPTRSLVLFLQMVGRVMRHSDEAPIVLDHAGNAVNLGLPVEDRAWSLDAPKRRRGGVAPCKRCPSCEEILPTILAVCPECSFVFWEGGPPAELAGELVEMGPRQTKCAGWPEGACEAVPERRAFTKARIARRGGRPWICFDCAIRKSFEDPEVLAKKSAGQRAYWNNPENAEHMRQNGARLAGLNRVGSPGRAKFVDAIRRRTESPTWKEAHAAGAIKRRKVREPRRPRTPEERRAAARKGALKRDPEERRAAARKGAFSNKRTAAERAETIRKTTAAMTPEQRRQKALKAWETRRKASEDGPVGADGERRSE